MNGQSNAWSLQGTAAETLTHQLLPPFNSTCPKVIGVEITAEKQEKTDALHAHICRSHQPSIHNQQMPALKKNHTHTHTKACTHPHTQIYKSTRNLYLFFTWKRFFSLHLSLFFYRTCFSLRLLFWNNLQIMYPSNSLVVWKPLFLSCSSSSLYHSSNPNIFKQPPSTSLLSLSFPFFSLWQSVFLSLSLFITLHSSLSSSFLL